MHKAFVNPSICGVSSGSDGLTNPVQLSNLNNEMRSTNNGMLNPIKSPSEFDGPHAGMVKDKENATSRSPPEFHPVKKLIIRWPPNLPYPNGGETRGCRGHGGEGW